MQPLRYTGISSQLIGGAATYDYATIVPSKSQQARYKDLQETCMKEAQYPPIKNTLHNFANYGGDRNKPIVIKIGTTALFLEILFLEHLLLS